MNAHRPYAALILLCLAVVFVLAIGGAVRGAVVEMEKVQTTMEEDGD